MKEKYLEKYTCNMCGEEVLVESLDLEKTEKWSEIYDNGGEASLDFCPTCTSKIDRFIQDGANYLRERGQIVENDENALEAEHGGLVKKYENGACKYADGFVLFPCMLCNYGKVESKLSTLIDKYYWTEYEKFSGGSYLCGDCSRELKAFIGKEATENLARMKKALARFAKPE